MYVVSFDIVGFFIAVILLAVHFVLFDNKNKVNRLYQLFLISTAVEAVLDIYTARIIDGVFKYSDAVCIWLNTAYLAVTVLTAFLGYRLLSHRFQHVNRHTRTASVLILAIGALILIFNAFSGAFFTFKDGKYIKTSIFLGIHAASIMLLFLMVLLMFFYRKSSTLNDMKVPVFFLVVLTISFVAQLIFPMYLFNCLGKAISAMGFCLFLDSPEHLKLVDAVDRLKESQAEQLEKIEALNEANRQKTDFLVRMSHELKTPINAILGLNEIILSECDEEAVRNEAEKLDKYGNNLLDIVDRMVDFSQLETGSLDFRGTEYDAIAAYHNVDERLSKICSEAGIEFVHSFSEDIPKRLFGDNRRIDQILEELAKLSMSGYRDGCLKWEVRLNRIDFNIAYLEIAVSCKGKKVLEDAIDDNRSFNYKIIEKIVECMQCELRYPGEDNNEVVLIIPQEIVDLKPIGNLNEASRRYLNNRYSDDDQMRFTMSTAHILAVDDMKLNLDILEALLQPFRLNITKATSGEEALELMKRQEFDLVFMDILMPGMDGVETLNNIRRMDGIISRRVPAIALTANTFFGAHDKYLADGFADYITKPVKRNTLARALRKFLPDKIETDWEELYVTGGEEKEADLPKSLEEVPGLYLSDALQLCADDMELYRVIAEEYCNSDAVGKLEELFEAKDWKNYQIQIHGLKSSSKSVGLNDLSEDARKLEFAARDMDIDYILANHRKWVGDYTAIVEVIKGLL